MTLFISNPSRQQAVFFYRRAITRDNSGPSQVVIPEGGQVEIGHGWGREETDYVITQILRAGGASAAEAHGHMGSFTGLLYREQQPVDTDEILTAHEGVKAAAEERSVANATRGALAFDRTANKGQRQRLAKVTEVEVIQELAPREQRTGNEAHFKMSIDPDGSSDARGIRGLN